MTELIDLVIDCDPGIDDALALFLAAGAADRIRLRAVTCVAGNRPVDVTTLNACRLLDAAGLGHLPVFAGAARPLAQAQPRCNLVHGEDGLGGLSESDLPRRRVAEQEPAAEYLARILIEAPLHSITLVAIGPLTNLALAEARQPGVLRRARALLVMGGALTCAGNVTPAAEFNFYADPEAAQVVLGAGVVVDLFPLDVTGKALMSAEWIDSLLALPSRCAQLSHAMLKAYASQDPLLHDACPVAYLLRPELFTGAAWHVTVEGGGGPEGGHARATSPTAADSGLQALANVHVLLDVDSAGLLALVRSQLARLP